MTPILFLHTSYFVFQTFKFKEDAGIAALLKVFLNLENCRKTDSFKLSQEAESD